MVIITVSALTFGIVFEINSYVLFIMLVLPNVVIMLISNYFEITRKPLVSARVKVVSMKVTRGYSFDCLLPDGNKERFGMSKKQWLVLKKNEHIEVVYQGRVAHSIKKYPNGVVVFRDEFSQVKVEKNVDKILTYEQAIKRK